MKHRATMCPNPHCVGYEQETRLLGGCGVCGTALVAYEITPTFEQLARFAATILKPDWIVGPVNVEILARLLEESAPNGAAYVNTLAQWRIVQREVGVA